MTTEAPQPIAFNCLPSHLTWERLESLRLKRLGIPNRYSRHCNIVYNSQAAASMNAEKRSVSAMSSPLGKPGAVNQSEKAKKTNNSIAPFYTHEKRTCGYFFSRDTDNKKRNFGIPPSDLVAWRSQNPVQ